MGKPVSKVDDPFSQLLEDITSATDVHKVDLTAFKKEENRGGDRVRVTGYATISDPTGKFLTKAAMRNISPDGVGFEISQVSIKPEQVVAVEFGGAGLDIGTISCTVQWIAPIEFHTYNHKMVGLKFNDMADEGREKLEMFMQILRSSAGFGSRPR